MTPPEDISSPAAAIDWPYGNERRVEWAVWSVGQSSVTGYVALAQPRDQPPSSQSGWPAPPLAALRITPAFQRLGPALRSTNQICPWVLHRPFHLSFLPLKLSTISIWPWPELQKWCRSASKLHFHLAVPTTRTWRDRQGTAGYAASSAAFIFSRSRGEVRNGLTSYWLQDYIITREPPGLNHFGRFSSRWKDHVRSKHDGVTRLKMKYEQTFQALVYHIPPPWGKGVEKRGSDTPNSDILQPLSYLVTP